MLGVDGKFFIDCLREKTTRTKTLVPAITFKVPMTSVSPEPKPPYLSGSVTYADDQTVIFHSGFT